ncbi:DUF4491 family protein [Marinilabiliaceae bacterium JC017]|nr:DUF4491 family protein [Marinilabiliaceae bacterium JC017]
MNGQGILIGLICFVIIGVFHPVVIKLEYYFGKKVWWMLALPGVILILISTLLPSFWSILAGVLGAGLMWSTLEIFMQHKRVLQGRAKRNPNRHYDE